MTLSRFFATLLFVFATVNLSVAEHSSPMKLRAPAYPLMVHDPYFSVWSFADKLTDVPTAHWTGKPQPINGTITIDNEKPLRFMGAEPKEFDALPQTEVDYSPTQTVYTFANEKVKLTLQFTTPALPDDLDLLSRPLSYLTYQTAALDGKTHNIILQFNVSPLIAINTPEQKIIGQTVEGLDGLEAIQTGHAEQPILEKKGDNLRIDWGYFYLATKKNTDTVLRFVPETQNTPAFLSAVTHYDNAGSQPLTNYLMFAYDDIQSIRYFEQFLLPYWRRNGLDASGLLRQGAERYQEIVQKCRQFDEELIRDLTTVGGQKYAELCALVYRQTWGANKIVAAEDGMPYMFSKENFSNGCIGTVDVLYPHTPFLLLFSPQLLKGSCVPVLNYAESERWKYGYAPHDLGTYPHATGQVYGMGNNAGDGARMPVEESGNMLIIVAALAEIENDTKFAEQHWDTLTRWGNYLVQNGFDPENQLCSADMFGHLAHVTNLSLKAILGIGAYAKLCELLGKTDDAKKYRMIAEDYAQKWLIAAKDDGRTRLAYDKPGTWSMKHNLIWDAILETHLFPESLAAEEIVWYKKVQNRYGLPVDSRTDNSLIDWTLWSITPAKNPNDFETLFNPIYNYVNETPDRVPVSDWFFTTNAKRRGFQARSVVGGVYIKVLTDQSLWKKYSQRAERTGDYRSKYPANVTLKEIIPTSQTEPAVWRYTLEKPDEHWIQPDFDDSGWRNGKSGFGGIAPLPNNPFIGTVWTTNEIWLRHEFELNDIPQNLFLYVYYDESPEIWVNGVLAAKRNGYSGSFTPLGISPEAVKTLKKGKNVIAVKASQTYGGQYIDVGLAVETVTPALPKKLK
ncbi:MAG: DUF4965 domain-containing protein [Planctomycetaceae bacterium]|jgi:hypothetical protein|nr:DUF4965 domain-containing protein [Planctomycetaceae bacterium]